MNINEELVEKSDEDLMEMYQNDNQQAFTLIYQRYSGRVIRYMKNKTKSDNIAQELTQEAFLKIHRSKLLYKKQYPLAPWVFTICRNVFLDFAKKKSLEDVTESSFFDQLTGDTLQQDSSLVSENKLLNELSEQQKQVVNLRLFNEATFDEIAAQLTTTPENARQLFSRALRKLKTKISLK